MRSGLLESGFQSAVTYLLSVGLPFFCSFQNSVPLCLATFREIRARGQRAVTILIPGTETYFPRVSHIQEGEKLTVVIEQCALRLSTLTRSPSHLTFNTYPLANPLNL